MTTMKRLVNTGCLAVMAIAIAYVHAQSPRPPGRMSFFVTSVNPGAAANLGGLAGADAHCQKLASGMSAGDRRWRAYLSARAMGNQKLVHARDRIGKGPWFNAKGVQMAADIGDLHGPKNRIAFSNALTERGEVVPHERHDMLTGSNPDGTLSTAAPDTTCNNWTSNGSGRAVVGHHDKVGGPLSWNSAHLTQGCSQKVLQSEQGDGLFYCFAAD